MHFTGQFYKYNGRPQSWYWQATITGQSVIWTLFWDDFIRHMIQPTVSQHWTTMVSQPDQRPITPLKRM